MMGWVYMGEPKIVRNLDRRSHLKDLGVCGRIILKCRLSIVIFRLGIGPGGGFLRTQYRIIGFHKRRIIS
jgi:hypothetical protein